MHHTTRCRRSLDRLARLTSLELAILVAAWILLPLEALAVRLHPRRAHDVPAVGPPRPAPRLSADRVTSLVAIAARHHVASFPCLPRALTARTLLHGLGIPSTLRIGVLRRGGRLRAHAWIESAGRSTDPTARIFDVLLPVTGPR